MSDFHTIQHKNDDAKVPSEIFKPQSTTAILSQVSCGELMGFGSETGSTGSTRRYYRAAEKR